MTPGQDTSEMTGWIKDLAAQHRAFREKIEERQMLAIPSKDSDREHLDCAFPSPSTPERDAILQPPKSTIKPSAKILELARGRDAAPEAAG